MAKFRAVCASLAADPRPLFIDEADYLASDGKMLDTLRDIHDETGAAVVLAGMDQIERRLARHPQFARRVSHRVEFGPCDAKDTALLARELCGVAIERGLLKEIHAAARGCAGLVVAALAEVEKHAAAHGWPSVDAERWGERPFFLGDRGAR
jgi:DNA transposition AAA+ family ATPase